MNLLRLLIALFSLSVLTYCGKEDKSDDDDHGGHNHGTEDVTMTALSETEIFHVSASFSTPLKAGQPTNSAHITITNPDMTVPEGEVVITAFHPKMPGHGHGTNEDNQKIEKHGAANGHFMVTGIHFSMGGDEGHWVVDIEATVGGQSDSARVSLPEVK